jgi:hypothetical protein
MSGTWPTFMTKYGVSAGSSSSPGVFASVSATQCVLCVWITQAVSASKLRAAA